MKVDEAIDEFLTAYPRMSLKPPSEAAFIIEGEFPVLAQIGPEDLLSRTLLLKIEVPALYPDSLPMVYELEYPPQIPNLPHFHKNSDGSFCLGTPFDLFCLLSRNASLVAFARECIVPHLAAALLKKERGVPFPQGELEHADDGLIQSFRDNFSLNLSIEEIYNFFSLLGKKRRLANKIPCPCGSKKPLGKCLCPINRLIASVRVSSGYSRRLYRNVAKSYEAYLHK